FSHKMEINSIRCIILRLRIKELEQENSVLTERNSALRDEADYNNKKLSNLMSTIYNIQAEYHEELKNIRKLKTEYKTLIKDVLSERKKFKQESAEFIKRIHKS
ncbi:MAG: hypothetical protein Q4G33_11585, partial [bacterium]|nr:hypothetical protein [bacterium]